MKAPTRTIHLVSLTLSLSAWLLHPQSAQCFYNPNTGRWLSRDPIGEHLDKSLYAFALNDSANKIDILGQRCCLITVSHGESSKLGHSILTCDNGVYISHSKDGDDVHDGRWRTPKMDFSDDPTIGFPGSKFTTNCSDCLDETKVKQWLADNWNKVWSPGEDCAKVALEAIESALPEPQTKPHCPCPSVDLALKGCSNIPVNLLNPPGSGIKPGIIWPDEAADRLQQLIANGCQKWKCQTLCPKYQHLPRY
jgi:hypothetical protein